MNPEISPDITDEERQKAAKAMQAMARILDEILNGKGTPKDQRQYGFSLLVYPFDHIDQSHINYIGSGERSDVLTALKELVARWEGRAQDHPTRQ
jgi:hypothetical protein